MLFDIFQKYKKPIQILVFILIISLLGYLIYFTFFRQYVADRTGGPDKTSTSTELGQFPQTGPAQDGKPGKSGDGKLPEGKTGGEVEEGSETAEGGQPPETDKSETTIISQNKSQGMTLDKDGSGVQYYDQDSGKFYRIDENGNAMELTDKVFHNVKNVNWSPAKDKAILEYPDGSNILYEFSSDKQVTLPKHWEEFEFSARGDKIVAKSMGLDPDNRWLAVSNPDGSNVKGIEPMGENADSVYPSWSPNSQIAGMYTRGAGFDRQDVFFIGLNDENFKSMTVEGRGFQPKWSPSGDKLVYSVYSSQNELKPKLWVANAKGESIGTGRKSINIDTWAEKCAFSGDSDMYCAVPKNLEKGAGIFPEMANSTADELYKVNIETGTKQMISSLGDEHNISDIKVSEDGKNLFFTDKKTQQIHKLEIK